MVAQDEFKTYIVPMPFKFLAYIMGHCLGCFTLKVNFPTKCFLSATAVDDVFYCKTFE